jgi:hypothetical protein
MVSGFLCRNRDASILLQLPVAVPSISTTDSAATTLSRMMLAEPNRSRIGLRARLVLG